MRLQTFTGHDYSLWITGICERLRQGFCPSFCDFAAPGFGIAVQDRPCRSVDVASDTSKLLPGLPGWLAIVLISMWPVRRRKVR